MAKGQIKPAFELAKKNGNLDKLFEALRSGLNRQSAIIYAGLNVQTVYDRMEKMPDLSKKMADAEHYWLAIVENIKRKKIVDEMYRPAIEKELKSKMPNVYGDKQEITGAGGGALQITRMIDDKRDQRRDVPGDIHSEPATEALGEAQ